VRKSVLIQCFIVSFPANVSEISSKFNLTIEIKGRAALTEDGAVVGRSSRWLQRAKTSARVRSNRSCKMTPVQAHCCCAAKTPAARCPQNVLNHSQTCWDPPSWSATLKLYWTNKNNGRRSRRTIIIKHVCTMR